MLTQEIRTNSLESKIQGPKRNRFGLQNKMISWSKTEEYKISESLVDFVKLKEIRL